MDRRPSLLKAHLALGLVAVLYGINYFFLKPVFNEGHSSFAILAIRCFSVSVIFLAMGPLVVRERIQGRRDWILLVVSALVGITFNQTLFLWGMAETSRVNSAVLQITSPVFVMLAAVITKEEVFTWRKYWGFKLAMGGAVALILAGSAESVKLSGASIGGDIKIALNAALYGTFLVIVRPLLQRYHTITVMKWLFVIGSVPNVLIGLPDLMETDFAGMSGAAIWGIVYLVVFGTVIGYFLNAWAMKILPSSAVGAYVYVQPVLVTLVSAALGLGEVTWLTIPLIFLIFAGVYLVTYPHRRPPNARK